MMQNLLKSGGIAIISTLIYAISVSENERQSPQYNKNIMGTLSIVMFVFSILFIFSGGSQELVSVASGGGSPLNAKPPF